MLALLAWSELDGGDPPFRVLIEDRVRVLEGIPSVPNGRDGRFGSTVHPARDAAIRPEAWVIDDTGFEKGGIASPCVARQYSVGHAGQDRNCQIGVSVHAVTDAASCPLGGWLFVPGSWGDTCASLEISPAGRRQWAASNQLGNVRIALVGVVSNQ